VIKIYCVSKLQTIYDIPLTHYIIKDINFFLAVKEYKFLQNIKSKLSNDSEEIGEIDVANKFFKEFEAYHNDKKNLKAALSPYKVSQGLLFFGISS